jgi:hypothetical protein
MDVNGPGRQCKKKKKKKKKKKDIGAKHLRKC